MWENDSQAQPKEGRLLMNKMRHADIVSVVTWLSLARFALPLERERKDNRMFFLHACNEELSSIVKIWSDQPHHF